MTNPLLADWTTAYELPPFAEIKDDDFAPAIDAALTDARAAITAIAEQDDAPDFENTIEALELADTQLNKILGAFFTLSGTDSNDAREALMRDISPKLAAYGSEITMNAKLFARIDALWQGREGLNLTAEQDRVLMLTRRAFVRSGAELEGDNANRLSEIKERLAVLGTQFGQNLLADERTWHMDLAEADLEGLPDFVKASARAAGVERGLDGPVITLSRSLITPFLQFSPRRDLRQKAFEAYVARGAGGGETDNREIALETLALRQERARLLGYDSFAAYKLETEMAATPQAVRDLLTAVWTPARAKAEADSVALTDLMRQDGINGDLEPWDWHYYAEKRRKAEHDLDESELKPFLQLDKMIEAAFACSTRLFGLSFKPVDVPLHHPDARAWDVSRDGKPLALFVADYFARGSKRSGAWCSAMRSQQKLGGDVQPIVVNVCNFSKPAPGDPALLSYDDARTLFHEFGHALHQMLSDVTYGSISGTSVSRDFVELPSQLYEHWLEVPEVMSEFAVHADTGASMPEELLTRLLAAQNADQGFATVEYVASAMVDLEFHSGPVPKDIMARQAEILDGLGMPRAIRMRHATPHFAHVFTGDGYSSGYYSYMWSEVMDADAFAAFQEAGSAFDRDTAAKLEKFILSAGGSEDPKELYTKFRGKLPEVDALLKGRGLDTAA
ncbi:M3 family metallopeptidase [Rhodobacteraceae bacterium SC52]|nr:M3 family metallopeptidase [Rhodobacteraceae bacterium SC52]